MLVRIPDFVFYAYFWANVEYDVPNLPCTNNDREKDFRTLNRRLLRTTGQKSLTLRIIRRQYAWELLPHPDTLHETIRVVSHIRLIIFRMNDFAYSNIETASSSIPIPRNLLNINSNTWNNFGTLPRREPIVTYAVLPFFALPYKLLCLALKTWIRLIRTISRHDFRAWRWTKPAKPQFFRSAQAFHSKLFDCDNGLRLYVACITVKDAVGGIREAIPDAFALAVFVPVSSIWWVAVAVPKKKHLGNFSGLFFAPYE